MTKVEIINKIIELDDSYKQAYGKLWYMSKEQLLRFYLKIKKNKEKNNE